VCWVVVNIVVCETGRQEVSLAEGGAEGGVLDAKLVNESPAFFPATIGFICGGEGSIEEL